MDTVEYPQWKITLASATARLCGAVRGGSLVEAPNLAGGRKQDQFRSFIMPPQGYFTLPPNIRFGITGFANSAGTQTINVLVDNEVRATFTGQSTDNKVIGSQVLNSGKGNVQIKVTVNNKASDLVSVQTTLANRLNFALVGSEDGTDGDYNDGIVVLNWPLG
ncbi:hypothetical protein OKW34_003329 [Paraburkholderia youngii]|uniref:fucose-binding lectin II n=1 Tax=Paraburkholderia youngii TaxID=2782701 RepID=UPI003D251954